MICRLFVLLCSTLYICGCAQSLPTSKTRYLWPITSKEPKIEWIASYSGSTDIRANTSLFEMVVGKEDPIALVNPLYIASDGLGKVFVTDGGTAKAYEFDLNKQEVLQVGGQALNVIKHATGITVDAKRNVYVGDSNTRKIYVTDANNKVVRVLDLSAQLKGIGAMAFDKKNERLIIPRLRAHTVVVVSLDGKVQFSFGKKGSEDGELNLPISVALEKDGTIVVADSYNARIQRFTASGAFINDFGNRGEHSAILH